VPPRLSRIYSFAGQRGRWVWLRGTGPEIALVTGGPGLSPSLRGKAPGWVEVAMEGNQAWLLQSRGGAGALLRVPQEAGAAPEPAVTGLRHPSGLLAAEGRVFWIEHDGPPFPGLTYIPAAGPTGRLMCRESGGQVREIGRWPAGVLQPQPGDLVGTAGGAVYVRSRRATSTDFLRVPLDGGPVRRFAGEEGWQRAVLAGSRIYWTAASEEASNYETTVCVRRMEGDRPVTVTDWLSLTGSFFVVGGAPYYSTQGGVFRIPDRLGPARFVRPLSFPFAASDGTTVVGLLGAEPPVVPL